MPGKKLVRSKTRGRSAPKAASPEVISLDALYKAVVEYVEARGGRVVVIGGVEIQSWPGEPAMRFKLAISCTGRMPNYKAGK